MTSTPAPLPHDTPVLVEATVMGHLNDGAFYRVNVNGHPVVVPGADVRAVPEDAA